MRGTEFAELAAFAAVAEKGSFALAAAKLGVTPSALSQTLRKLEERLGIRLLNRTTRSVAPSEAGARLLARLRPTLADLDQAMAEVRALRGRPSGLLRINASRIAVSQWIAPLVGRFHAAYPDVVLDLVGDDRLVDIVAAGFDAGIRLGERLERDMVAVKVSDEIEMMVVASPSYLARHGTPKTPRDLRHHRCIGGRMPTTGAPYRWEFERGKEKLEVAVEGPLIVSDMDAGVPAALEGVGIAYLFDYQAKPWIAAGKLKRLLREWTPPFPGFYLYYPSRRQIPPALRAFIDFIRQVEK